MLGKLHQEPREVGQDWIPELTHARIVALNAGAKNLTIKRHLQRISWNPIDPCIPCKIVYHQSLIITRMVTVFGLVHGQLIADRKKIGYEIAV